MMGKKAGLSKLCNSSELVARLTLSLDSDEQAICTQVLELLAVLAVTSEAGYDSVRAAVDYFKVVKKEKVRFERLVGALASARTTPDFQRDVMLFVNTLVNSAPDVELRVEVRGELCRAGMMEAVATLKERNLVEITSDGELSDEAYELEVQLQVFESVLENDHDQLLVSVDASASPDLRGDQLRLDDADAIFEAVKQHATEFDCYRNLLAILQYLLAVPSYDRLGKQHWAALEIAAHKIVLGTDDDFALGFAELKQLLSWRRALESRAMSLDDANRDRDALRKRVAEGGPGSGPPRPAILDDPKYAKYFKMLKMHLPRQAIELKMKAEGLDVNLLDESLLATAAPSSTGAAPRSHDDGHATTTNGAAAASGPPLSADPVYGKYFKMLAMHLPRVAVESKMRAEGLDPSILNRDPAQPCDPSLLKGRGASAPKSPEAKSRRSTAPARRAKPQPAPSVAMRSLFWSKIHDDECDVTVWKNLSDARVKLDVAVLEAEFAKSTKARQADAASREAADAAAKKREVSLVDGKVSQNVGIALVKLKLTKEQIVEALVSVDEARLDVQRAELLLKCVPNADDAAAVADFRGDPASLGRVEQFFLEVQKVPDVEVRLKCLLFKLRLESTAEQLDERLRLVASACEQVAQSERLARLLEVVLAVGNYLNGGSSRGGCYGFRLDTLAKLSTVKSVDNRRSLVHYVVEYCETRDPQLLEIVDELCDLDPASRCSLAQWQTDFGALKKSIDLIKTHVDRLKRGTNNKVPRHQGDRFVAVFEPFLAVASDRAADLERRHSATRARFENLIVSFGEDPAACTVDVFFKELLGDFVASLSKAKLENDHRRQMDEKAAKKRAAFERRAALRAQGGAGPTELVGDTLSQLKAVDAMDVLAKLQGPRQRRARVKQPADDANGPSLPSSKMMPIKDSAAYHMQKFISRSSGAKGKTAEKLEKLRSSVTTPDKDARPGEIARYSPRQRESISKQAELQTLISSPGPSTARKTSAPFSTRATASKASAWNAPPPSPPALTGLSNSATSDPPTPQTRRTTFGAAGSGGELFAKLTAKTVRKKST